MAAVWLWFAPILLSMLIDSLAEDGQLYEHSGDYYTIEAIEDMLCGIEEETDF